MSEEMIIRHCAPTLAGIKVGGLFNCPFKCQYELKNQIEEYNDKFNCKGVYIILLRKTCTNALIYVYRPGQLEKVISNDDVAKFLVSNEYSECSVKYCIEELSKRLCKYQTFPHEIGLFLGYPLSDVKGFIEHKGQNCKLVGYWKVYSDEYKTKELFEKYKKCTNVYCKKFSEGLSIQRLTVTPLQCSKI